MVYMGYSFLLSIVSVEVIHDMLLVVKGCLAQMCGRIPSIPATSATYSRGIRVSDIKTPFLVSSQKTVYHLYTDMIMQHSFSMGSLDQAQFYHLAGWLFLVLGKKREHIASAGRALYTFIS